MHLIQSELGLFSRVKAAEHKKKKKFHPKSSAKKERTKYYDLILKKLESLPDSKARELPPTDGANP